MPRPAGLSLRAAALLGLLAVLVPAAIAQAPERDCTAELRLEPAADGLVDLRVTVPCQPYARVDIAFGPFIVTEEASHEGHVDLRLPRIAAVPEVAAQVGETTLFAALPETADPLPGFVALIWAGDADLALSLPGGGGATALQLGFPLGAQARRAAILVLDPDAQLPDVAEIAIAGAPCSPEPIRAALLTSASRARLPLTFPAPGCGPVEGAVRLALPQRAPAP